MMERVLTQHTRVFLQDDFVSIAGLWAISSPLLLRSSNGNAKQKRHLQGAGGCGGRETVVGGECGGHSEHEGE